MDRIFPSFIELKSILLGKYKKWFLFGILFHLLAAIFSEGFLQYDEHFEIIEFLSFKLGITPEADLTMEYGETMRPWVQPFLYYPIIKFFQTIGIENRFFWVFSLRLISALLGFYSIILLSIYSLETLKNEWQKKWAVISLNLLWFIPFIHARTSCEAVGGSLFAIAFTVMLLKIVRNNYHTTSFKITQSLMIGLLMGMAFNMRYHIGFMILFVTLWALLFKRVQLKSVFLICVGVVLAILIGTCIDYWGYGKWTLAPYWYFHQNITLNLANKWGTSPWWGYFTYSLKKGVHPITLPLLIGALIFWAKKWKHELTWLTLPFFFVHSYVAHKEMRFLFPIVIYSPLLLIFLFNGTSRVTQRIFIFFNTRLGSALFKVVFVVNFILLIQGSLRPVQSSVQFYKWTYKNLNEPFKKVHVVGDLKPYGIAALNMNFYNFHYPEEVFLKEAQLSSEVEKLVSENTSSWVFASRGKNYFKLSEIDKCKLYYLSIPKWMLKVNIGNWISRSELWSLFKCEK